MKRLELSILCVLLGSIGPLAPASAQPTHECAPTDAVHAVRLLRQTSLDLRGHVASYEELREVQEATNPIAEVDAVVARWMTSDDFFAELRRQHRSLLWSNLAAVEDIVNINWQLRTVPGAPNVLARAGVNIRRAHRGGLPGDFCLDQRQTRFDSSGRPVPIRGQQEGWVEVEPYWAPGTRVRVCAFDAMDNLGSGTCDLTRNNDTDCGCGPNLQRCVPASVDAQMRDALADEPAQIFESVVRGGRPYYDAFSTRNTRVNGPLAHYYRYLRGNMNAGNFPPVLTDPRMPPPTVAFTQNAWRDVARSEDHAGILTTPGYLMRFNSHRARASHFYATFLCNPFVPSAAGIPAEEDEPPPNLRERAGCADCHEVLEPAAAHWGRWRINSTFGFLDESSYSLTRPLNPCRCGGPGQPACNNLCNTYYVTGENSHADTYREYAGLPLASIYLTASERRAFDSGPAALVDEEHERAQVASCAVRTLAARLLGRPVGPTEVTWLSDHVAAFEASGQDYTALVNRLVSDPKYRAIR